MHSLHHSCSEYFEVLNTSVNTVREFSSTMHKLTSMFTNSVSGLTHTLVPLVLPQSRYPVLSTPELITFQEVVLN
jgi:hypothetical protein